MTLPKIEVLIADDGVQTRENIRKILSLEDNIIIVGESSNGQETVKTAIETKPDVILMDVNMPVMNGIQATEIITLDLPETVVIIMSAEGDQEYLRKAMIAGARDFLVKPFTSDALITAINRVYEREKKRQIQEATLSKIGRKSRVISIYSPHDGVGKSMIATNLAVCLAKDFDQRVALVDLNLQFGDIDLMLNLAPERTLAGLISRYKELDADLMEQFLTEHKTGVKVLAAPPKPEYAETVTVYCVERVLETLKNNYSLIIVDTSSVLQDITLAALDVSNYIFLVTTFDLPSLRNAKLCLEVMDALHYPKEKIKLVMNRASGDMGIKIDDVSNFLNREIDIAIPSEGRIVVPSVNQGKPFIMTNPQSDVSECIRRMARTVLDTDEEIVLNERNVLSKIKRALVRRRA
jgi:pilus assembly protein CpaE